ncbi:MAG TPA: hypothetical protein VHS56_11405 [Candidatus Cybelea sp.]|jgi:hypothetical protein|nr:hypothetical protein [Candidatus Cybelea sp.]
MAATFGLVFLTAATPQRAANGNVVTSTAEPQVHIEVPARAAYVGTDAWVLYGIADCRQFVYAEPDSNNIVKQLYWIQFESYLPSLPKLHHQYASKRHARLGGLDFYVDTWTQDNRKPNAHTEDLAPLEAFLRSKGYAVPAGISSGSDGRHVDALLAAKGLRLPAVTASVRFVHLADARERKELMIIYSENAGAGAAPEELIRRAAELVRVSQ